MSFLGLDPGDPNNWYQSPQLGQFPVSPVVYGGGISGGCYSTHSYHPHGSPRYPPPPSQYPSQPSYPPPPPPPSQTIINGYVFPPQFPHLSANHAQLSTAAHSPYNYPFSQNQRYSSTELFTTTPQSPLIPIHPHPSEIYHRYPPTQPHFIPTKQSIPSPLLVPTAEHLEHPQFSIPAAANEEPSSISPELEMGHRIETNISTKRVGLGGEEEVESQIHGVNPEPSWLMKQTEKRKFTLHDGNGNAGICYSSSLGSQENDSDVSLVPPIVSEALKGQETLDSIHSLCLKTQRKKLICGNATEDFVNLAVNVNVDVNIESVSEGPEFVTANLKQELGIVPTQGTSIHQAKPWSAHDVEVNDERLEYHALHLFDKMPRPDVYSWNAILGCYCKAEGLMDAGELFLKMPERNIVSWKTLISALVRNGQEEKGLGVYDAMISEGMVPTHFTLAIVFSACGGWLDVEKGWKCHSLVEQIGLEVNVYVRNTLLCMYAKCGVIKDAMQVFGEMAKPNEITFTAMMGELKKTDKVLEALEMFKLMWRKGVHIDLVTRVAEMMITSYVEPIRHNCSQILSHFLTSQIYEFEYSLSWYLGEKQQLWGAAALVLGLLVEVEVMKKRFHKHINSVLQVIKSILLSAIDVVTHDSPHETAILFWKKDIWEAMCKLPLHQQMWLRCISSHLVASHSASVKESCSGDHENPLGTYYLIKRNKVFMIVVYLYCQLKTQINCDVANKLITQNLVVTVCGAYSLMGQTKCADSLSSMLGVCAKGCCEFGDNDHSDGILSNVNGQKLHGLTVKLGFEGDLHLNNSLFDVYAKSTNMKSAEKVFASIHKVSGNVNLLATSVKSGDLNSGHQMWDIILCSNVIPWSAILFGYFQNEDHMESCHAKLVSSFQVKRPCVAQITKDGYVNVLVGCHDQLFSYYKSRITNYLRELAQVFDIKGQVENLNYQVNLPQEKIYLSCVVDFLLLLTSSFGSLHLQLDAKWVNTSQHSPTLYSIAEIHVKNLKVPATRKYFTSCLMKIYGESCINGSVTKTKEKQVKAMVIDTSLGSDLDDEAGRPAKVLTNIDQASQAWLFAGMTFSLANFLIIGALLISVTHAMSTIAASYVQLGIEVDGYNNDQPLTGIAKIIDMSHRIPQYNVTCWKLEDISGLRSSLFFKRVGML